MDLSAPDLPLMAGEFVLTSRQIERQLRPFGVQGINGPVRVELTGRGEIDAFDGEVRLTSDRLELFGIDTQDLDVELAHSADGEVDLLSLSSGIGRGRIYGHGAFEISNGNGYLDVWPDGVDVSHLQFALPNLAIKAVAGPTSGAIHLEARKVYEDARQFRGIVRLETERTHAAQLGLGEMLRVDGRAELVRDELDIERLYLAASGDTANVQGSLNLDTLSTDLSGRLSIDRLLPITSALSVPVRGALKTGWTMRGRITEPKLVAKVDGKGVGYSNLPTSDVSGTVGLAAGVLELDRVHLRSETGSIGLQGTVDLQSAQQAVKVRLSARQFELSTLPLGIGVSGRTGLDVRVSGTLKRPVVKGRARIARPCWKSPHREDPLCYRRFDTEGQWSLDRFDITRFTLRDDERILLDIEGRGRIRTRAFEGRIALNKVPLDVVNYFVRDELPVGAVTTELSLAGTLTAPRGEGDGVSRGWLRRLPSGWVRF